MRIIASIFFISGMCSRKKWMFLFIAGLVFMSGCRKDESLLINLSDEMTIGDYTGTRKWFGEDTINYPADLPFRIDSSDFNENGFSAYVADRSYDNSGFAPMFYLHVMGYLMFGSEENHTDTTYTFSLVSHPNSNPQVKIVDHYSTCSDPDTVEALPTFIEKQRTCIPGEVIKTDDAWNCNEFSLYQLFPTKSYPEHAYINDTLTQTTYYRDITCWNAPFGQPIYIPFKTGPTLRYDSRLGWVKLTLRDSAQLIIHEIVTQE